jgi:hypothetical protein
VPLVVLSRQPDDADKAAQLGVVAGLQKPLNVGALMGTVRQLVSQPD